MTKTNAAREKLKKIIIFFLKRSSFLYTQG